MNRIVAGTCLAAAFAIGVSAQATPPQNTPPQAAPQATAPQTPPQTPPMQESRDAGRITVTGCLKAGEQPDSFVLSDLKWNKDDKDKPVGTSGAVPPAIAAASSLKLIGSPSGAKFSEHVGHTVEVSGTVSDKGGRPSAAPADPAGARPPASAGPSLDVRTLKMVSATCSTQ